MNRPVYFSCRVVVFATFVMTVPGCVHPGARDRTALDRYIARVDPVYTYSHRCTVEGEGFTGHIIGMTSQSWLTPEKVDRTVWKHWLTIVVPDEVSGETGLLFISGGHNGSDVPDAVNKTLIEIAVTTRSVVAELRMVPNQPLTFVADETRGRSEDALVAYTWDKFLRGGDETWLARLPMTKSAVRAMDTVTSFCAGIENRGVAVSRFVVAGASKRGWTAWTTAAVDDRVVAIVPIVIDMLNLVPSFRHHWESYGFWAPAVQDYVDMRIMDWFGHPAFDRMLDIVDPYSYRERYTMPKFIMNSTGDQFFLPDSSQFYFDGLPGDKFLRYVPNTDHGLGGSDAIESLTAFYDAVLTGTPLPRFLWNVRPDGSIRVETEDEPVDVVLWQATNPDTRDFRKKTIGKAWTATKLTELKPGVYAAIVPEPEQGWTAFMVELTYASRLSVPFKFTTGIHVVPETMPFTYRPPQM